MAQVAIQGTQVPAPGVVADKAPVATSALWLEVVSDPQVLASLAPQWQELADGALEPNAFYEPWMALPALRTLESSASGGVQFLLAWAPHPSGRKGERQLCGLFPVQSRSLGGLLPVRVQALWRYTYCYLCTPLLRPRVAREVLELFLDWVGKSGGTGRLFGGEFLPAQGAFYQLLVDALHRRGWSSFQRELFTRALLRRASSAEQYLELALAGRRRKELRRLRARLEEQGRLTVEQLQPHQDWRPGVKAFVALEARSWKGGEGVALGSHPTHLRFFEQLAEAAHARGRLELLALELDGRPVAMKLNLQSAAGSWAVKIAFDPDFARFSPGVLLEVENINRQHEQGAPGVMDSCADPSRFMINHLWTERLAMQSLWVATDSLPQSLLLGCLPLAQWARRRLKARAAARAAAALPLPSPRSSDAQLTAEA